jgi:hypothetical protein
MWLTVTAVVLLSVAWGFWEIKSLWAKLIAVAFALPGLYLLRLRFEDEPALSTRDIVVVAAIVASYLLWQIRVTLIEIRDLLAARNNDVVVPAPASTLEPNAG